MRPRPRTARSAPLPAVRRRRTGWVGALAAGAALLGACGPDAPDRGELVRVLRDTGMPEAQAECAADAVGDNLSDDQVAAIAERGASGVGAGDEVDEARRALAECAAVGVTTTTAPPAGVPEPGTAGTVDGGSPGPDSVGPGPGPTAQQGGASTTDR